MRGLLALAVCVAVVGCSTTPEPSSTDPTSTSQPQPTSSPGVQTSQADSGGVAPMTTAPIPNAPVAGSESLQGGGSAVGTVAKDRAKQAASQASGSSLDQGGE